MSSEPRSELDQLIAREKASYQDAPQAPEAGWERLRDAVTQGGAAPRAWAPRTGLAVGLAGVVALGALGWALSSGPSRGAPAAPANAAPVDAPRVSEALPGAPRDHAAPTSGAGGPTPAIDAPSAAPVAQDPAGSPGASREPATEQGAPEAGADLPASTGRQVRTSRAPTRPEQADRDSLAAELALLSRARAALNAGRYDEALAIAAEHAAAFPSGVLAPERRAVASRARCRQGAAERGDADAVRACP